MNYIYIYLYVYSIYIYIHLYINVRSSFATSEFRPQLRFLIQPPPGRHSDLSCCSRTTFRPILMLWEDISTHPVARSGTTFRSILLLWDDILTYPQDDVSTYPLTLLGAFLHCQHSSQIELCGEVSVRICGRYMHASATYSEPH